CEFSAAKPTHQIYRLLVRYPHLISRGRTIPKRGRVDDRYHPAPLRDLSLFGESSDWSWSQGPGMEIGGDPRDYAKTRPDGADRRLPQNAGVADTPRHLF